MDFINSKAVGSIKDLNIQFNPDGWGPINGAKLQSFYEVPYAHFDKKDKINRSADFVQSGQQNNYKQHQRGYYKRDEAYQNADFTFKHDAAEDNTFQLVDSSKAVTRSKGGMKKQTNRFGNKNNNNSRNARNTQQQDPYLTNLRSKTQAAANNGRTQNRNFRRNDRKPDRLPSLTVSGDWEMIDEFDIAQLTKLVANLPQVEDLHWSGHLDQYDDSYDKLTTRSARTLRKFENKIFYYVSTKDDPILEKFAVDGMGDVYATDSILSQLMAAPRSVYSWDIVIQKLDGMIFLDKREDSNFDYLTVSETAQEAPIASEEVGEINYPENLSLEATRINQNFSQQIINPEGARKQFQPNPFFDESETAGSEQPASVAYRYRRFTLGNIRLVARCELHSWTEKHGQEQLMSSFALNEWDSRFSGGVNWRQKIDQQRGAVLATELKNNSCKLAKWTAQSLLAGASQMKLGYVTRVAPNNPYDHQIVATQFVKPKDFAAQINLSLNNVWGIIKMICELLLSKPDGKFVLLKDPNKPIVHLYSVPLDTFEEAGEDEEEDGAYADDDN